MRNQRGITLIALVITIIVLLILAGVSIAMLTGENGILTRATDARDDTVTAEAVEKINMALNAAYAQAVGPDGVVPTEANVKAQDSSFASTANGYTVDSTTTPGSITIKYSKDGVNVSGSILASGAYTITPAQMPAE